MEISQLRIGLRDKIIGAEARLVKEHKSSERDSQRSDEELIRLTAQNESWALAEIYDRYSRLVFSLAIKTLNDRPSAEEVVQEVFTKVWRYATDFDPQRGTVSSWLVGIAHHQCIDELRRRRIRPIAAEQTRVESLAADSSEPFDPAVQSVQHAEISSALEQIPTEQRLVIELAFYEGLTQQQIAARLKLPLGTVKSRIRLGMLKLKELVQRD